MFADFIAIPLADIFNKSFNSKRFPVIWKDFVVSPIPKTIPCPSVDELRSTALTSAISKLQESYVVKLAWADPVLGKLGACLRYKISDILELLMRCSFIVKL